jgi:ABC-type Fe3+-hydroxamate transport system substrate-binding protein
MAAGSDNFINELLKLNHFQNIYDTKGRYPAVAIEDIVAEGDPDFVFLLQNPILLKKKMVMRLVIIHRKHKQ